MNTYQEPEESIAALKQENSLLRRQLEQFQEHHMKDILFRKAQSVYKYYQEFLEQQQHRSTCVQNKSQFDHDRVD